MHGVKKAKKKKGNKNSGSRDRDSPSPRIYPLPSASESQRRSRRSEPTASNSADGPYEKLLQAIRSKEDEDAAVIDKLQQTNAMLELKVAAYKKDLHETRKFAKNLLDSMIEKTEKDRETMNSLRSKEAELLQSEFIFFWTFWKILVTSHRTFYLSFLVHAIRNQQARRKGAIGRTTIAEDEYAS